MNPHETARELDATRAKYRGHIIPKPALAIMDAETARLAASNVAGSALKMGDSAPDFILPNTQGDPDDVLETLKVLKDRNHLETKKS
jgi:hypothetical protein